MNKLTHPGYLKGVTDHQILIALKEVIRLTKEKYGQICSMSVDEITLVEIQQRQRIPRRFERHSRTVCHNDGDMAFLPTVILDHWHQAITVSIFVPCDDPEGRYLSYQVVTMQPCVPPKPNKRFERISMSVGMTITYGEAQSRGMLWKGLVVDERLTYKFFESLQDQLKEEIPKEQPDEQENDLLVSPREPAQDNQNPGQAPNGPAGTGRPPSVDENLRDVCTDAPALRLARAWSDRPDGSRD